MRLRPLSPRTKARRREDAIMLGMAARALDDLLSRLEAHMSEMERRLDRVEQRRAGIKAVRP